MYQSKLRHQDVFRPAGWLCAWLLLYGCRSHSPQPAPLFEAKTAGQTGLHFVNKLTPTKEFNDLKYMYYYNGAGVGAGDFNNDGKVDIFFAANQGDDQLYLNEGGLHFKDVTKEAGIPQDGGWSTGVSVVDINNDGLLDIYICRVGNFGDLHSRNQLLVCKGIDKNGVPHYEDEAKQYGLDFSGFSTQAVFFDYDGDGDLDMYLLNHTVFENGTVGPRNILLNKKMPASGDRIFRNDGGHFTDVTDQTGINSSVLGYGLGINVSDIDLDGYPDIYVGNDFHENDYLYINQHNGTFKDELDRHLMHTSKYSMGVDVADANNDGYPDIVTLDMLPTDPYTLKRSLGDDEEDIFFLKTGLGYNYQYSRNNLQLNRRNGMFSEIGLYAGIAATDWSWSPLWMDFDNDGLKDLFISNGIPHRLNDIDYINLVSNREIQEKLRSENLSDSDLQRFDQFPQIKIYNKFFKNTGDMKFQDLAEEISNDQRTFSNGAAYADFDNDGDLDIVVNNINDPAVLYANKANDKRDKAFTEIKLIGPAVNINALGAKIILFCNGGLRIYEKYPVHGFLSSMEIPVHIGLDRTQVDSAFLVWPDNSFQPVAISGSHPFVTYSYHTGLPRFDYRRVTGFHHNPARSMKDITDETGLAYKHEENDFQEFDMDLLLPHMVSTEGPALAIADINHDGLDDVFIGAAKGKKCGIFLQQRSGRFIRSLQPDIDQDSNCENVSACWADVNGDGYPDLVVASGGNEYVGHDQRLAPRAYLNDGNGHLKKSARAFDSVWVNASCVIAADFNGDGYPDLFIGGRSVSYNYGQVPRSYLLLNDGKGHFLDVTDTYCKELGHIGFVTSAVWCDINKDGAKDLVLSLEWGGIIAFINQGGSFTQKVLTDKKGWWNFIMPVDLNGDGRIDFIAGNLGLNTRLRASVEEPVRLYYCDFDGSGKKKDVLTYYLGGRELPFANKEELEKQMPYLKKKFPYAADFAKASLEDIFSSDMLKRAQVLSADYFANAVLINDGHLNFTVKELPWEAQLSPYRDAVVVQANGDSLPDILLFGNYYGYPVQMGRSDADFGTILLNRGNGNFIAESLNGVTVKGQVRHVDTIHVAGQQAFVLARNNDSARVIRFDR